MYHRVVEVPKNALRVPLVLVDCFPRNGGVRSVVPDDVNGGLAATKLLLEKGHRRIATIIARSFLATKKQNGLNTSKRNNTTFYDPLTVDQAYGYSCFGEVVTLVASFRSDYKPLITSHQSPFDALRLLRATYCLVKLFFFSRRQRIDSRVIDKLS
jgi:hypothetical protein